MLRFVLVGSKAIECSAICNSVTGDRSNGVTKVRLGKLSSISSCRGDVIGHGGIRLRRSGGRRIGARGGRCVGGTGRI